MRYIYFVQGEGRGHLSQALCLKSQLEARGHELLAVIIGSGDNKPPLFFQKAINAPVFLVDSPGFLIDKKGEGIRPIASIIKAITSSPRYAHSLKKIRNIFKELSPDIIISFYEPLAGVYVRLWQDKRPLFCVAHQYFIDHPAWKFPPGDYSAQQAYKLFNRLNAPRRAHRLALSFTAQTDIKEKNLFIVPPLIRPEIKQQPISDDGFVLAYLLNPGYQEQIKSWSLSRPEIKIEAFSNAVPEGESLTITPSLISHGLSGDKFLKRLASCRAYVSTAGFDSVAEAAYLGKSILVVPTKNHFEQKCNAYEVSQMSLALSADNFKLDLLMNDKNKNYSKRALSSFRQWVDQHADKIVEIIESGLI